MIDALTLASERINGMYLNGGGTDRPTKPVRTERLLRQRIGTEVAKAALMDVYEAMLPQSGEDGYGKLVGQLGRGRAAIEAGPLGMDLIADLSLSAEDGRMGLKKNVPVEIRELERTMRISDMARIVAATWHSLNMNRSTW